MTKFENQSLALFNDINKTVVHYDSISGCVGLVERLFFNDFKSCLASGLRILNSGRKLYWDKDNDLLFIANKNKIDIYYISKIAFLQLAEDNVIDFEKIAEDLWSKFDLAYVKQFLTMTHKKSLTSDLREFLLQNLFPLLINGQQTSRNQNFVFHSTSQVCVAHFYWGCALDLTEETVVFY